MNVDAVTRRYYFASQYLYYTLSAIDYLLDDLESDQLIERHWSGSDKFHEAAEWLLGESYFIQVREGLIEERSELFKAQLDTLIQDWVQIETKVLDWADRGANEVGHDMNEGTRAFDEETKLYYFACGWPTRVLHEFDNIMATVESIELKTRYQENQDKFTALLGWLQSELSSIESRHGVSEREARALQDAVRLLSDQLAAEWRKQVEMAAKEATAGDQRERQE